jgi:hypothetical protein
MPRVHCVFICIFVSLSLYVSTSTYLSVSTSVTYLYTTVYTHTHTQIYLCRRVFKFWPASESPGGLLKQVAGVSDEEAEAFTRMCISNKFPGATNVVGHHILKAIILVYSTYLVFLNI